MRKVIYPPAATGEKPLEENMTYDGLSNLETRVDTAGRTTTYEYDTSNRLIKITDALKNLTQFEYDNRSHLTKVKDALNQEYVFTYDALGRRLTQSRAGSTMSFEYDAVGNRTRRTDYVDRITDYEYDVLNRLKRISYLQPGAPTPIQGAVYTYDSLSRLASAANDAGTVGFTYDNRNRLKTETDVFGRVVEYGYDANGNRTLLKLDGANHAAYAYDNADRLTTLTNSSDNTTTTYGYDVADRIISRALPNGITTSYDYDGMSRLKRLKDSNTSATIYDRNFAYNNASQITQITGLEYSPTFEYDNLNRLTFAVYMAELMTVEDYAYDAIGNRTSSHLSSTYGYQPFNRVASTQTATYGYDANGNMTTKGEGSNFWRYTWDYENRMTEASTRKERVRYKYDALGRRVQRFVPGNLEKNTKFTYDGHDMLLDDNNGMLTKYQNGPGIDNKLSLRSGTDVKYFLQDHLGGTVALTDPTGMVAASQRYDSFGNGTNPNFPTRYQYTGREYDAFSGFHFYRARWYDAKLGRFISEDPIGFEGGDVNLYGYVANQPLMLRDPFGKFPSIFARFFSSAHQNITERALAGHATPSQIRSIAGSNVEFDKRTQDSIYAPYHSMRRYGQTSVEDARDEANEFVRNKICTARDYASRGWNTDAMNELGKAVHTLQDAHSPAHAGFQEAWPGDLLSMASNIPHYVSEAAFPGAENTAAAEQATRDAWRYFNGAPMPSNFFR